MRVFGFSLCTKGFILMLGPVALAFSLFICRRCNLVEADRRGTMAWSNNGTFMAHVRWYRRTFPLFVGICNPRYRFCFVIASSFADGMRGFVLFGVFFSFMGESIMVFRKDCTYRVFLCFFVEKMVSVKKMG